MKAFKDFFKQNKMLVSMTGSATFGLFLVFTIIAVIISGTPTSAEPSTQEPSASDSIQNVVDNESSESTDVTLPPYVNDDTTCGSEDETPEEPTTEPPVDPNTLPYMIMVNRAANCVTVYGKDSSGKFTVPVKAITVSCGKNLGDTPTGTYQTINEYNWRKMVDGTYAQYAYRIVGPILFHSVPYYTQAKNNLEWEEFNKLGTSASLGCVRMTVADAKWLMDNCPIGTLVKIYDDAANPGPLGKPETIKIPVDTPDELKKWDPTDPDPSNPWKLHSSTITHPVSKHVIVMQGATIKDVLYNFSAKDTCGNDISDKIEVEGNLNTSVPGVYTNIKISVTDAIGSRAEVVVTVTVDSLETESPSINEQPSETETTSEQPSETETTSEQPSETETTSEQPSETETTSEQPSETETTSEQPSETETTSEQPSETEPSAA